MSNCDSCPSKGKCSDKENCEIQNNPLNKIKHVIGVVSGKGGVGKSSISVLLAKRLREDGFKVGILDADITGPSIPKLLNLKDKNAYGNGKDIFPVETEDGIKVMSLNLLVDDEETPVIWRGPVIAGAVKQFWTDVLWGDIDYLVVDMPPGTGDVSLTVMQSMPISGLIMVSVPQDLVSMIVAKSINMAKKMNIKLLGIIENMSYIVCPDCKKKIKLFESGENTESFLKQMGIKFLGEMPMEKGISSLSSNGDKMLDESTKKVFESIYTNIIEQM